MYNTCKIVGGPVAVLIVLVSIGVVFLLADIHFSLVVCAMLSLVYWFASICLCITWSPLLGYSSIVLARSMRDSWLLFPPKQNATGRYGAPKPSGSKKQIQVSEDDGLKMQFL